MADNKKILELPQDDGVSGENAQTYNRHEREDEFDKSFGKPKISTNLNSRTTEEEKEKIESQVVDQLNKFHAVVHTDQFYILTEKPHTLFEGIDFTLESKQSFLNFYENQIPCGHTKTKAQIWLKHTHRRQFRGIAFNPITTEHVNGLYNIWKGFAIKAISGKCELFKFHLKNVVCCGDEEYFTYIWKWMAHLVQRPQELSPGLVFMGEQGIGKNTVVDTLGSIFGQHYLPLDNIDQFLGHFNFHLKNAVLIHGNEAIWGGDKRQLGKLKAMVTERFCIIEGKGKDQLTMRNFKHLILSSNEDWPVHLDRDDRRFLVLTVSNKYKDDRGYFEQLHKELNSGGREAILYELLNTNLFEFDVWKLPQNIEAFEVKMLSAASTHRYIFEVLSAGSFDVGCVEQSGRWHEQKDGYFSVPAAGVFLDYRLWCDHQGFHCENEVSLGKAIINLIPSSYKSRPRELARKNQYNFPILTKARAEFQKAYKVGEGIWF